MNMAIYRSTTAKRWWVAFVSCSLFACVCVAAAPAWAEEEKAGEVGSRAVPASPTLSMTAVPAVGVGSASQVGGVQADLIYVSITSTRQGKFRGEIPRKGYDNKIAALNFEYGVAIKPDAATGLPTGRRQHRPVRIMKVWGAASTQLFSAMTANESLSTVVIDFVVVNPTTGAEVLDHTITLTNAIAASIQYQMENVNGQYTQVESVEFTFQKITMTDAKSQTMAMDDWAIVP
jgi:type VI secretion system secreted protein Hcp